MRIKEFLEWAGEVVAVRGRVEQAGHSWDGAWVIAVPRVDDMIIDFESSTGPCGIVMCFEKPEIDASSVPPNHPEAVKVAGGPVLSGHAMIRRVSV